MIRLLILGLLLSVGTASAQDAGEVAADALLVFLELADGFGEGSDGSGGYCSETSDPPPFQTGLCGKVLDADPTGACVAFDNAAWRTANCNDSGEGGGPGCYIYPLFHLLAAGVVLGGVVAAVECIGGGLRKADETAPDAPASAPGLTWDGRPVEVVTDRAEADLVLRVRPARRGVGIGDRDVTPTVDAYDPRSGLPLPVERDRQP